MQSDSIREEEVEEENQNEPLPLARSAQDK